MRGLLAGLVLLLAASSAIAQVKDSGWYVGAGFGSTYLQSVCNGFQDAGGYESCDDTSVGWKVLLGKNIYKYTYLEGEYTDAGEAKIVAPGSTGNISVNPRIASLFLKFLVPVGFQDRLGVYAKFGGTYYDTTYDGTGVYAGAEGDDGVNTAIGAGVSWRGWNHFSLLFEWENFNDAAVVRDGDVNMGSISLLYHF